MTKQKVIIGRIEDYSKVDEFIQEVFDQFKVKFEEEVIVKPNFLKFDDPSKRSITHPEVVRAVVGVLKDMGVKSICLTIVDGVIGVESSELWLQAITLWRWTL